MVSFTMKIIIPGGSGQVGAMLARAFLRDGHEVVVLSRGGGARGGAAVPGVRVVSWDGETLGPWADEIDGCGAVVNLAGRSVNCRYHAENRRQMIESRVRSTRAIGQAIGAARQPPSVWLNASTATIYRHALDRPMDETTGELGGNEPGAPEKWNFSIEVAKAWEDAFLSADTPATRKVAMRSAMTMSADPGGVFDVLLGLVRKGLGGASGNGRQFVSWVHEDDFTAAVSLLLRRDDLSGTINIASPHPLPNREFMAAIRRAWGMPVGLPATAWMLEIGAIFLRTETELILKSRRVIPTRLLEAGFTFKFPLWPAAAEDLCRQAREAK